MLTPEAIENVAKIWYRKLDVHAPKEELTALVIDEGLEMVFPEATVYGWEGFLGWYDAVINIFFDEEHTVKSVVPEITGDTATVKVVVEWKASLWKKPAANSERIECDAYQTWEVKSDGKGGALVTKYIVDEIKYHEGSATL